MTEPSSAGRRRSEALPAMVGIAITTCFAAVFLAENQGAGAASVIVAGGVAMAGIGYAGLRNRRRMLHNQFAAIVGGCGVAAVVSASIAAGSNHELGDSSSGLIALLVWALVGVTAVAHSLARSVATDINLVSAGLMAVGEGNPRVTLDVLGDDETGRLAAAGNRMIEQLMQRQAERDEAERTRQALVRAMVDQLLERSAERDSGEARRRQLAAAASHDVRTPLTSLRLLADALRDELVDPDDVPVHASRMLDQITVLHRLTEQVFELARLEAGDVAWAMVEADLGQLLREAAEQLELRATERGLSLVVEIDERVRTVLVAPEMVLRLVANILQNAIEHTPEGGHIRLTARSRDDAFMEAEVSDTGQGIAAEDREQIFEPFFRGDRSRTGTGTGLGLSIARGIVEAHGGRIWLVEGEGGTCLRFTLPVAEAAGKRQGEGSAD